EERPYELEQVAISFCEVAAGLPAADVEVARRSRRSCEPQPNLVFDFQRSQRVVVVIELVQSPLRKEVRDLERARLRVVALHAQRVVAAELGNGGGHLG